MKYNVINEKLKIANCSIADLTLEQTQSFLSQWEKGASIGTLTLFYEEESDLVVLNRDNKNYDFFLTISERYLSATDAERNRIKEEAPEGIENTMRVLDGCIRYRSVEQDIGRALKNIIDPAYRPVINSVIDRSVTNSVINRSDAAGAACIAFRYGVMCGKREERARRKAGVLNVAG